MNEAYLQGLMKLLSNPETKDYFQDQNFMGILQQCMANPQMLNVMAQQDPRLKKCMEVIAQPGTGPDINELLKNMGKTAAPETSEAPTPPPAAPTPPPAAQKMEEEKELDPAEAAKQAGNREFKARNFLKALDHYQEAIQINPSEVLYYNNRAAAFIELGDLASAENEVKKAEQVFEEGGCRDFSRRAKVYARKASIMGKKEDYEGAIAWFEKSLVEDHQQKVKDELRQMQRLKKRRDELAYIDPVKAEEECEEGSRLFREGKFPDALKRYEESIRRNPDVAKYYSNLGTVFIKLADFERAKGYFEQAIAKDPNFIKAYPKKGDCHYFLKEYHKALQAYEAGLKVAPDNQLCKEGVQKTQTAIYSSGSGDASEPGDQEARAKRAMADPEIQAILKTPEIRNVLAELEANPNAIKEVLQNKDIADKLGKLMAAGVLKMG